MTDVLMTNFLMTDVLMTNFLMTDVLMTKFLMTDVTTESEDPDVTWVVSRRWD